MGILMQTLCSRYRLSSMRSRSLIFLFRMDETNCFLESFHHFIVTFDTIYLVYGLHPSILLVGDQTNLSIWKSRLSLQ